MLKSYYSRKKIIEAGTDEAGRGCLSGPVHAAAVILDRKFKHSLLNDSKKLTHANRVELRQVIQEKAIAWAVATASVEEIDEINILNASHLAMHRSLEKLSQKIELILVDGNRFKPFKEIPFECIIKGDGKYASIAAASILAKTYRDDYMLQLHEQFPEYGWDSNKGYPTKKHRAAIAEYGATPHHRLTFRLLPDNVQTRLFNS